MKKFDRNKTFYINTSKKSPESIKQLTDKLVNIGFKYVPFSSSDFEDFGEYFLAVNPSEKICYMDCVSSDNIATEKDFTDFFLP